MRWILEALEVSGLTHRQSLGSRDVGKSRRLQQHDHGLTATVTVTRLAGLNLTPKRSNYDAGASPISSGSCSN